MLATVDCEAAQYRIDRLDRGIKLKTVMNENDGQDSDGQ